MTKKELEAKLAELEAKNNELAAKVSTAVRGRRRRGVILGVGLVTGHNVPAKFTVADDGTVEVTEDGSFENGPQLPRMQFQDWLFEQNETWHLTDNQLAILNRVEHPTADGRMDVGIIVGMRALYNLGRHSKAYGVPATPSKSYGLGIAKAVATK